MALQQISPLHFQFFPPQTKTLNHIFKFALSCSNSNHKTALVEIKKKKHRPSFSDQIRHKWSLKLASQTQKFPWQEQQQQDKPELVEQPQSQEEHPQPLNFEFPKRLSPWHVAENPKQHPQNDSESDASEDKDNVKRVQRNSGGSVMEREFEESESSISSLKKRRSNTELAEKLIPEHELQRLRNMALRMVERFSVGVAGITQELVDAIHEKWMVDEVVKFKFDSPLSANMKRAHQILEV
jgi:RNA-binding protein YhbY